MLHKNVLLANLQVHCATDDIELNRIAGQIRNLFYAASLPWCEGNLGRVIPRGTFDEFYGEYQKLRDTYYDLKPAKADWCSATLIVIPFPAITTTGISAHALLDAPDIVSDALQERFERRVRMLKTALTEEKRFYTSLLSELGKIIKTGVYLLDDIKPELLSRLKKAETDILCYSADDVRKSVSLREDIINLCGALL